MKPVCLITGAGGLLGNALCRAVSDEYDIVAAYRKNIPKISSQLVEQVNGTNKSVEKNIYAVQADLTIKEDIRRLVDVALAKFGRIDCVVNSAVDGMSRGKLLELYQSDDYATPKFYLNSIAPFQLISYIHDSCWKDDKKGNLFWNRNIVNISSVAGIKVYSKSEAFYSASKAALNMLTLHLSLELTPYSVRVNSICPGRFSDGEKTYRVAYEVKKIMQNSMTGTVISGIP